MRRLALIVAILVLLLRLAGCASGVDIGEQLPSLITAATVQDATPAEAPAVTYVLNKNSRKFHYPDCASVDEIKEKNRQDVSWDRDEVIAQGYVPCKRCNP